MGKLLVEWKMTGSFSVISAWTSPMRKSFSARYLTMVKLFGATFMPSASYISEGLAQWDMLRDEMM